MRLKPLDDQIRALARRAAGPLTLAVKALIAEQVRAAADQISPPPKGDDALKVTLPNGITVQTESQGDVDALMGWLGQAPKSVLGGSEVLRRALDDESGEPPAAPSVRVPAPQPAVEKGEALPPARALRINDAESWPAELEAEMASVRLEVTKQTSDFETESGKRNKPRVAPAPNVPATLGRLALVGPTAERYHGQVVYLWRCPDCGVEARLCGQAARRRKGPTECRCAEAAVPKAAPPAEPPCAPTTSPAAASPAPAPSHDLAHPLKPPGVPVPPPIIPNPRFAGVTTLIGMTFRNWKVVERTGGGDGRSYWRCRCTKCGASKEIAALGQHGLRQNPPACGACRLRKGEPAPAEREDDEDEDREEAAG